LSVADEVLRIPCEADLRGFRGALAEYVAHRITAPWDPPGDADAATLRAYVASLADVPEKDLHRWYFVNGGYVGRITLRRGRSAVVTDLHGHVGYDVRPSAWGLGHATRMLCRFLAENVAVERSTVRITCSASNLASRRVIEKAGGVLVDDFGGYLRFDVQAPAV
jgi:RimJ/RimL family protein N-acetyltransferase